MWLKKWRLYCSNSDEKLVIVYIVLYVPWTFLYTGLI
jgi:hypothetical protein